MPTGAVSQIDVVSAPELAVGEPFASTSFALNASASSRCQLRVEVTRDDIEDCRGGLICHPVARALSRITNCRWRVWEGRVAQEMSAPYRSATLPTEVQRLCEDAGNFALLESFVFEVEFDEESDSYA